MQEMLFNYSTEVVRQILFVLESNFFAFCLHTPRAEKEE